MFLESFQQDLRLGLRALAREKGFCALAIAAVALGIAAVTTEFAIVDGAFLRGFPFPHQEQLVDVRLTDPASIYPRQSAYVTTMADFADLKAQQTVFDAFVAYMSGHTIYVTWRSQAQGLEGCYVSHDFFRTLGVVPALGRDFLPDDDRPGVAPAVILSDSLWQGEFGGDPQVLGRAIRVNGVAGTIVGIMPPRFNFPRKEQLWVPINTEYAPRPRGDHAAETRIIARLRPGVSCERASAETAALALRLAAQYPENKSSSVGGVFPLGEALVSPWLAHLIFSMLAFSVGVLLIACVNVMNMQFARATLRVKELAIRSALGATRHRLLRQMFTESLLLTSLGSALGVALAAWAIPRLDDALHSYRYPLPSWMTFSVDGRVLALAAGVTVFAGVAAGLLPALAASRPNVVALLKEAGRGSTGGFVRRAMRALVVFQLAVSSVLLIGSLIDAQSIARGQNANYGYDTSRILAGNLTLMAWNYPTNESRVVFYEKLLRELRATPPLESAALTNRFQMIFAGWGERIELDGRRYDDDRDRPVTQFELVSDGYWAVTGQRVVAGRDFTLDDNDVRRPVAVVNETFAHKHFGRDDPVGHRFRMVRNRGQHADRWRTIVGVVSDVRMLVPANVRNDNAGFYLPFNASIFSDGPPAINGPGYATIILRVRGDARPESAADVLRGAVGRIDPDAALYYVDTPKHNLAIVFSLDRALADLFALFGAVAALLTAIGFYAMVSFSVNQRTQEFGIRMALGADRRRLVVQVLRECAGQLGLGLGLGLATAVAISFAAEEWVASLFLFDIGPRDPRTYAAVALMFCLVGLVASLVPARHAASVDPTTALRAE